MSSDDHTLVLPDQNADSNNPLFSELERRVRTLEELVARRGYDTRPIYEKHETEITALQREVGVLKASLAQARISPVAVENQKREDPPLEAMEEDTPLLSETQVVLFSQRMARAFPGLRNLQWLSDSKEAVRRLSVLLSNPLIFRVREGGINAPIWWWRGNTNDQITKFEVLSETKCLMNSDELEIDRLAVYRGQASYRDFVYIETKAEHATGVSSHSEDHVNGQLKEFGFSHEEYGLFGAIPISREEFDDGAALIDGKILETAGSATLRIRYLSRYNFVIASQFSPINSQNVDDSLQQHLNNILMGSHDLDGLLQLVEGLPRHSSDGEQ